MTSQRTGSTKQGDCFGLVGALLDGKYQIDRLVAEGGFGVVYSGHHNRLNAPIAVKVLKTPADLADAARETFVSQFIREAQTIARVRHANIVQVLDVGASPMPRGGTAPWMVLEWLTGNTLQQELRARRGKGGRSPEECLGLLQPLLEAIAVAHDEGIAHRDIKPANIMLVSGRRGIVAKILDFGIAKLMQAGEGAGSGVTMTRGSNSSFSPLYASPEQVAGTRTGPWTDVHALALIMTELLTDKPPFVASDMAVLFSQVLATERPTPKKAGVDVGALEPVLNKALAFRPEDRHQNAAAFLAALQAVIPTTTTFVPALPSPPPMESNSLTPPLPSLSSNESGPVAAVSLLNSSQPVPEAMSRDAPSSTTLSSSVQSRDARNSLPAAAGRNRTRLLAVGGAVVLLGIGAAIVLPRALGSSPAAHSAASTTPGSLGPASGSAEVHAPAPTTPVTLVEPPVAPSTVAPAGGTAIPVAIQAPASPALVPAAPTEPPGPTAVRPTVARPATLRPVVIRQSRRPSSRPSSGGDDDFRPR